MRTAHLVMSGRVQGVGFRLYVRDLANSMNISGWVKNLADGRIEVAGQGDSLKDFVDSCKEGPIFSRIDEVKESHREEEPFTDFRIL